MYNNQPFIKRFNQLGDVSEHAFEEHATKEDIAFVRYGFNRPPLTKFPTAAAFVRFTPDYLAQFQKKLFFCEVKGTTRNDFKVKLRQIAQLKEWHKLEPVIFYIYNSSRKLMTFISLPQVEEIITLQALPVEKFENDQNEYYSVPLTWNTSIQQII